MTFSSRTCGIPEGALEGGAVIARGLGNGPPPDVSSRMEMRLLRETRRVFEYLHKTLPIISGVNTHKRCQKSHNFPIIAVLGSDNKMVG